MKSWFQRCSGPAVAGCRLAEPLWSGRATVLVPRRRFPALVWVLGAAAVAPVPDA